MISGRSHSPHLMALLAIFFVGLLIYSNTLHVPFIFDDFHNIRDNPRIRLDGLNLERLLRVGLEADPSAKRPVSYMSFALNYYFGGYDVIGYHIVNISIHILNGVLVYFLVLTLLGRIPSGRYCRQARGGIDPSKTRQAAILAALIFLAHPLQIQAVTYIVQRMTSMAVLFYLSALLLYVRGRFAPSNLKRSFLWSGCLLCWILALGTKQIAATLPPAILLCELFLVRDLEFSRLKRYWFVLPALVLVCGLIVWIYLGGSPIQALLNTYTLREFTPWERVITQFRVVVFYLSLAAFPLPSRLNLVHHIEISRSLLVPATTLLCLFIILALIVSAISAARRWPIFSFCVLWVFIHLVVESSIVGLEMVFEHRMYLPMFGIAMFVSYLLFCDRLGWKLPAYAAGGVLILLLGAGTYTRNMVWKDRITLWSDVVAKSPQSYRAHYNLGTDLGRSGLHEKAVIHLQEALRLNPSYGRAYNNLGVALDEQGKSGEALLLYEKALQISPGVAEAHHNLALALERLGRHAEAMEHYRQCIWIRPNFAESRNNLGVLLKKEGKTQEAVTEYMSALRINPDYPEAHNNLAVALETLGRRKEAIEHYLEALRLDPRYSKAYNNLGVALSREGLLDEAITCYREALRIDPDDAGTHNNLGAALENAGKVEEALSHYAQALALNPDYGEAHNNMGIALSRQGNLRGAINHFLEALRIDPGNRDARRNLELAEGMIK